MRRRWKAFITAYVVLMVTSLIVMVAFINVRLGWLCPCSVPEWLIYVPIAFMIPHLALVTVVVLGFFLVGIADDPTRFDYATQTEYRRKHPVLSRIQDVIRQISMDSVYDYPWDAEDHAMIPQKNTEDDRNV